MQEQDPIIEESPQVFLRVDFPDGPHTTKMTLSISNLDVEQIGMAGRMLLRYFDEQYRAAQQQARSKIVTPTGLPANLGRTD